MLIQFSSISVDWLITNNFDSVVKQIDNSRHHSTHFRPSFVHINSVSAVKTILLLNIIFFELKISRPKEPQQHINVNTIS